MLNKYLAYRSVSCHMHDHNFEHVQNYNRPQLTNTTTKRVCHVRMATYMNVHYVLNVQETLATCWLYTH